MKSVNNDWLESEDSNDQTMDTFCTFRVKMPFNHRRNTLKAKSKNAYQSPEQSCTCYHFQTSTSSHN